MKKPNVFIVGAPKCGTTSLANWLSTHPQCFLSRRKEPHFFGDYLRVAMPLSEYESLFADTNDSHLAIIDASTSYLSNPEAIKQILNYSPSAKFIVMLRNPIELAYSWHSECLYLGRENIKSFQEAWNKQDDRKNRVSIPLSCQNPEMLLYKEQACIGKHLNNLLKIVGKERTHFIFLDDLKDDPRNVYLRTLEFLGLKDDQRSDFQTLNRSKIHRFPLLNRILIIAGWMRRKIGLPKMGIRKLLTSSSKIEAPREILSYSFKLEMYKNLESDILLLERITHRNLDNWKPTSNEKI